MKVTLKLFASLAAHLPAEVRVQHRLDLEVEPGTTVLGLILRQRVPPGQCSLVLVDGVWVSPQDRQTRVLTEGEVLAIWPPVAGG